MSVLVKLYQNYSDPNVVRKNLSFVKDINCEMTGEVAVDSLELICDIDNDVNSINYCYIPTFSRYYFVTPAVINGKQMRLSCISDPLSSFWNSFKNSPCIAKRSSSNFNPYIEDPYVVKLPTCKIVARRTAAAFTPSGSGGCYILTLGGK